MNTDVDSISDYQDAMADFALHISEQFMYVVQQSHPDVTSTYQTITDGIGKLVEIISNSHDQLAPPFAVMIETHQAIANWMIGHIEEIIKTAYIRYNDIECGTTKECLMNSTGTILNLINYTIDMIGAYIGLKFHHGLAIGVVAPKLLSRLFKIYVFCRAIMTVFCYIKAVIIYLPNKGLNGAIWIHEQFQSEDEDEEDDDSDEEPDEPRSQLQTSTRGRHQFNKATTTIDDHNMSEYSSISISRAFYLAKGLLSDIQH